MRMTHLHQHLNIVLNILCWCERFVNSVVPLGSALVLHTTKDASRHAKRTRAEELTSRDLPLSSLANAERLQRRTHTDFNPAVKDEKDHLHLSRILDAFGSSRGQVDHSGAKKIQSKGFCILEFGAFDVAHFDSFE